MEIKRLKIFIGTREIAGMTHFLKEALTKCGHNVVACVDNSKQTFYNHKYDINLSLQILPSFFSKILGSKRSYLVNSKLVTLKRYLLFLRVRKKFDLYIFMWDSFATNDSWDLKYFFKNNIKVIWLFLGSDVRHITSFQQEYGLDTSIWEDWFKTRSINEPLYKLRKAELYCTKVLSVPDQMGLALRSYQMLYIPFDTTKFQPVYHNRQIPKIVHVPSARGIKGTKYIQAAIEQLKTDGLIFEFECISGVTNDVVIQKLMDADILIDEAFLYGPGTLSLEGVSCGCAVATRHLQNGVYADSLVYIDINNLYHPIKKMIEDKVFRNNIAINSLATVKKINDPTSLAKDIINLNQVENLIKPTFFENNFKLNDEVLNLQTIKINEQVLAAVSKA